MNQETPDHPGSSGEKTTALPWYAIVSRAAVAIVILAAGAGMFIHLQNSAPKPPAAASGEERVGVSVFEAQVQKIRRSWEGFGTAQPVDRSEVPAEVSALVAEIPSDVRSGRAVRRDQLLMRLDDRDFQRQVAIARQQEQQMKAQLDLLDVEASVIAEKFRLETEDEKVTRGEMERTLALQKQNVATQREADLARRALIRTQQQVVVYREQLEKIPLRRQQMEAQWKAQQETRQLAELNLSRCRVTSPLDGVLEAVDVKVGEWVRPGQRLAFVVNLERIEVLLKLPSSARGDIQTGQNVQLENSDKRQWSGRVDRLGPQDEAATRTMTVFVEVDQREAARRWSEGASVQDLLWPGSFVSGSVSGATERERLMVPRRSVSAGRLWVLEQDQIQGVPVTVDFSHEGRGEGLLPDRRWLALMETALAGREVVLDAARSVTDGQRVRKISLPPAMEEQP